MKLARIQFVPWDKSYYFDPGELNVAVGDRVIVRTELGVDIGEVIALEEAKEKFSLLGRKPAVETGEEGQNGEPAEIKPILRKAESDDLAKIPSLSEKMRALEYVKQVKEKLDLPMKFIDVHYTLDGTRATFAFIADGRVDFREMVKDLTRHFGRAIRLQQIGIRDEARIMGDVGHCGRLLCCREHLKDLSSITSDMAELQQCSHRGSDRISGACGRLMCCLSYEQSGYEDMLKKLPAVGEQINVEGKKGTVVAHHILKQSVKVALEAGKDSAPAIVEVSLSPEEKEKERKQKQRERELEQLAETERREAQKRQSQGGRAGNGNGDRGNRRRRRR